jgi:dienelactone hydrolase
VPVQILAPEFDAMFTPELKEFSNKAIPTLGVPYDYRTFPGVEHSFATRGDQQSEAQMRALMRAKNAAVYWFRQWLH